VLGGVLARSRCWPRSPPPRGVVAMAPRAARGAAARVRARSEEPVSRSDPRSAGHRDGGRGDLHLDVLQTLHLARGMGAGLEGGAPRVERHDDPVLRVAVNGLGASAADVDLGHDGTFLGVNGSSRERTARGSRPSSIVILYKIYVNYNLCGDTVLVHLRPPDPAAIASDAGPRTQASRARGQSGAGRPTVRNARHAP